MFGDVDVSPQDENTPLRPRNVYGVSKVAAYQLMRVYREQHGVFACCGYSVQPRISTARTSFRYPENHASGRAIKLGKEKSFGWGISIPFATGDMPAIMSARCG